MAIFTHMFVDLDAVVSVWLYKKFLSSDSEVVFVPANFDDLTSDDVALDIDAGGKGIKGTTINGLNHCATWALWNKLSAFSDFDRDALSDLVRYVDLQDNHGDVLRACKLADLPDANLLRETGLNSIFRSIQTILKDDLKVLNYMETILDGLYEKALASIRSIQEAKSAEYRGPVAIIRNAKEFGTNNVLFENGAKAVVFVDGNNLGVVRRSDIEISMSHPDITALVHAQNESAEWFAHPAGFLFARGTRKAPSKTRSKIDPTLLADVVANLLS